MRIKVSVCDDNYQEIEKISKKILEFADTYKLDISLTNYTSEEILMIDIEDGKICPDILFLDINLPFINGVEIAKKMRDQNYSGKIIFFTASEEYYQEAFDVKAYNYIVKDKTSQERFSSILKHSIKEVIDEEAEYILFSKAGEIRKIPLEDIRYMEVYKRIIVVYFQDKKFEFYSTIGKMENKLYGHGFIRIHKSYLVNIKYIEKVNKQEVVLVSGETLAVGRTYYSNIKQELVVFNFPLKFRQMKEVLQAQVPKEGAR